MEAFSTIKKLYRYCLGFVDVVDAASGVPEAALRLSTRFCVGRVVSGDTDAWLAI
jgi:hypothetical protein